MSTAGAPNTTTQTPCSAGAEERFVTVDGIRVRYLFRPCSRPAPQSPPIILVHGLLGFSYSWRHNIDALSEIADIYAPDLPGVGYSERCPTLNCSFRGIAEFLFHLADALKLPRINLIASSHGGGVAIAAAARDLDEHGFQARRVQRLVLVAPVNPWSAGRAWLTDALRTPVGWWCVRACYPLLARCQGLFLRRVYGDPSRIERDAPAHYALPVLIPGTASHLHKILKSWPSDIAALRKSLATIREVPTLLIWGTCDKAVRPGSAGPLAECFRNAQIKMIECAGHLPYEETPEEFNTAVMQFLASSF